MKATRSSARRRAAIARGDLAYDTCVQRLVAPLTLAVALSLPGVAYAEPRQELAAARGELDSYLASLDRELNVLELSTSSFRAKRTGKTGEALAEANYGVVAACRQSILKIMKLRSELLDRAKRLLNAGAQGKQLEGGDPLAGAPDYDAALARLDAEIVRYGDEGMQAGIDAMRGFTSHVKQSSPSLMAVSIALVEIQTRQRLRDEVFIVSLDLHLAARSWWNVKSTAEGCLKVCRGDAALTRAHYGMARVYTEDDKQPDAAARSLMSAAVYATRPPGDPGADQDAALRQAVMQEYAAALALQSTPALVSLLQEAPSAPAVRGPLEAELARRDDYTPAAEGPPPSAEQDPPAPPYDPGRSRTRVREYWRDPPDDPVLWFGANYSAPITEQRVDGVRMREPLGLDIGFDALVHPRLTFGLWYGFNKWVPEGALPSVLQANANRLELRLGSDLLALPRDWVVRPALQPFLGVGLGWLKRRFDEGFGEESSTHAGIGLTLGAEGALHLHFGKVFLVARGGVQKPIYAFAGDETAFFDKGFPRALHWFAGGMFGFVID